MNSLQKKINYILNHKSLYIRIFSLQFLLLGTPNHNFSCTWSFVHLPLLQNTITFLISHTWWPLSTRMDSHWRWIGVIETGTLYCGGALKAARLEIGSQRSGNLIFFVNKNTFFFISFPIFSLRLTVRWSVIEHSTKWFCQLKLFASDDLTKLNVILFIYMITNHHFDVKHCYW